MDDASIRARLAIGSRLHREFAIAGDFGIGERKFDLGLIGDVDQLTDAQQRAGAHSDSARFDHRKPARRHHGRVRTTKEYAIAGDYPEIFDKYVRNAVRGL